MLGIDQPNERTYEIPGRHCSLARPHKYYYFVTIKQPENMKMKRVVNP